MRPPAEDILIKASSLFSRRGFAGTTTRAIAQAAGIRQPTLFHHYPTKGAILQALCAAAIDRPLRFAERVKDVPATAGQRLYWLIAFYAQHLCSSRYDLKILGMCPELLQRDFRTWGDRRRKLMAIIEALLQEGIRSGELVAVNPSFAGVALTTIAESSVDWFPHAGKQRPQEFAREIAGLALRGMLSEPGAMKEIQRSIPPVEEAASEASPAPLSAAKRRRGKTAS